MVAKASLYSGSTAVACRANGLSASSHAMREAGSAAGLLEKTFIQARSSAPYQALWRFLALAARCIFHGAGDKLVELDPGGARFRAGAATQALLDGPQEGCTHGIVIGIFDTVRDVAHRQFSQDPVETVGTFEFR